MYRYDRDTRDGALSGWARVARTTASLLLMCDPRDLGVLAQVQAPFTGRPTLYLYDAVPGGVALVGRAILGGFIALVAMMGEDRPSDSDPDDGAVV